MPERALRAAERRLSKKRSDTDRGRAGGVPPPLALFRRIGSGSSRDCYVHPDDPTLCVKIARSRRGRLQCIREHRYFTHVSRLYPGESTSHIARCHGRVGTDLGTGWVYDRVIEEPEREEVHRRGSTRTSPTLEQVVREARYRDEPALLMEAARELIDWVRSTVFVVRDLTPANVCVQCVDGRLRMVIVDGLGPRGVLPRWFPRRSYAGRQNEYRLERSAREYPDSFAAWLLGSADPGSRERGHGPARSRTFRVR